MHAEMEALLFCARNAIDARRATLYATTFPCHNCAKHIIAAGIARVVYVEPYPKSKAMEFHDDAIAQGEDSNPPLVTFEPFVGVGPRKFFDLFSMKLSTGFELTRKGKDGHVLDWQRDEELCENADVAEVLPGSGDRGDEEICRVPGRAGE